MKNIAIMSETNERLRKARIAAGYESASDAARAFGWTVSTYLGHENGDRPISKKAGVKYAKALKIDPLSILYEAPPKCQVSEAGRPDIPRLIAMVAWLLVWRGLPEDESENLAKAVVEYACKPLGPGEAEPTKAELRGEVRTLIRLYGSQLR